VRSSSSFDWTPAAIARLTELWLDGVTSGKIGRLMGVSRSAVMGKLRRLDLLRNDHRPLIPRRMPARLLKTTEQVSRPQKRPHKRNKRPLPPPPWPIPVTKPVTLPPIGSFDLLDLRNGHCRWPGPEDRPPYSFCGAPQTGGSSYCLDHLARSLSGQARHTPFYLAKLGQGAQP
jgi:GcrA cell cycle regulator